jgi:ribonuclease R/exosome complex exonuclease DIS3/RRP44
VFKLNKQGKVIEEWFGKTVINSNKRFSYEEAQAVIENDSVYNLLAHKPPSNDEIEIAIKSLDRYAKMMRRERFKHGSISLDKQEIRFKLDENNKPVGIIFKVGKDSNKLIEEFMLLANKHVAEFVNSKGLPMVNRAHEKPNEEKLERLKEFIKEFGYEIRTQNPAEITSTLNQLLLDVKGKPEANMVENLVVRTMQKATYTTKNPGHYGLGFENYAHFTSPIRRYPDVIVHRLLNRYLEVKTIPKLEKLEGRCLHLSEREKKAQKAERDSIKYMQCIYMADHLGKVFKGVVSSIQEYGVFVEIPENGCDGLVRLSEISGDTYSADINNYCIIGFNTKQKIKLGDEVHVIVSGVDVEKKNINLSLIRL